MKEAIDFNGLKVEVSLDTPVKTIDGVHYLLNDDDMNELEEREIAWEAAAPIRALEAVYQERQKEYGTWQQQLDIMYHSLKDNGDLSAWVKYVEDIKLTNPK